MKHLKKRGWIGLIIFLIIVIFMVCIGPMLEVGMTKKLMQAEVQMDQQMEQQLEQEAKDADESSKTVQQSQKTVQKPKRAETAEEAIDRIVDEQVAKATKGKDLPKSQIIGLKAQMRQQFMTAMVQAQMAGMTDKEFITVLEEQLRVIEERERRFEQFEQSEAAKDGK